MLYIIPTSYYTYTNNDFFFLPYLAEGNAFFGFTIIIYSPSPRYPGYNDCVQ
jgi:hypothetical protein